MSLKHSYTVLAPIYDLIVGRASTGMRRNSLARLTEVHDKTVLISGIGTGLDIPYLPRGANYIGMDLTDRMLQRARLRKAGRDDILLHRGDVMRLPYADRQFDVLVMHLILAVVPHPEQALKEASRVLKPGGKILILDKFLRRGQRAPLRRIMNQLLRHIATRTDVVLDSVLEHCPELQVTRNQPLRPGNWFHEIELTKKN